jgi:hypothetical protein
MFSSETIKVLYIFQNTNVITFFCETWHITLREEHIL